MAQNQEQHGGAAEWLTTTRFLALTAVVVIVAALFRLQGINWDNGTHLHPDERYLTMVVSTVRFPGETRITVPDANAAPACKTLQECLSAYWDTATSPLNPQNYDAYGSYVYGTLHSVYDARPSRVGSTTSARVPLCVVEPWSTQASPLACSPMTAFTLSGVRYLPQWTSRRLSVLIWLGCLLYDRLIGLLAGALYAAAVLPVQHSHFFVVDSYATVFVLWTLVFCVVALRRDRRRYLLAAGLATGLAVSSKAKHLATCGDRSTDRCHFGQPAPVRSASRCP